MILLKLAYYIPSIIYPDSGYKEAYWNPWRHYTEERPNNYPLPPPPPMSQPPFHPPQRQTQTIMVPPPLQPPPLCPVHPHIPLPHLPHLNHRSIRVIRFLRHPRRSILGHHQVHRYRSVLRRLREVPPLVWIMPRNAR